MIKERTRKRKEIAPKTKVTNLILEELEDEINFLTWEHGKGMFEITEEFRTNKKRVLVTDSLCCEIEKDIFMIHDDNSILLKNWFVSSMFLGSSIKQITKEQLGDTYIIRIVLSDGMITIMC